MVCYLVAEHGIWVDDVSMVEQQEVKRLTSVFRLRRAQLECIAKGENSFPLGDDESAADLNSTMPKISIDFFALLGKVISRFQVSVTPVEFLQYDVNDHVAYIGVCVSSSIGVPKWVMGQHSTTAEAAKQSLAKEVIRFLIPICKFEVIDVNFEAMKRATFLLGFERGSYLALKERIYGVREDSSPQAVLKEEEPVTQKGGEFRIPSLMSLPRPHKKRMRASSSHAFSDTVALTIVPGDLDQVVTRRKTSHQ